MADETKQQLHRAKVKAWFLNRPGYQRNYRTKRKQLRAELGTALSGTFPVKAQKKITYTVTVTRPLKPEERVHRTITTTKQHRRNNTNATRSNNTGTTADDEW